MQAYIIFGMIFHPKCVLECPVEVCGQARILQRQEDREQRQQRFITGLEQNEAIDDLVDAGMPKVLADQEKVSFGGMITGFEDILQDLEQKMDTGDRFRGRAARIFCLIGKPLTRRSFGLFGEKKLRCSSLIIEAKRFYE